MPCFIPFRPALRSSLAWACALAARQMALPARADQAAAVGAMAGSLDAVDPGGGVIFAEQIPKADWPRFLAVDAGDAAQYARAHLPGAINLAWRLVLAERAAGKAAGH